MVLVPQLLAKVSECIVVKLFAIVRDEDPRNPESVNDALLDEVTNIFLRDGCQWFYFHPFCEVFNPNNKELELSHCHRKGSHNVQSQLSERP